MYTKGPWHWEEDFPNAVDKNALVNESGDIVLQPVTGWDRFDKGIRTGGQHDGRDGSATEETTGNARLIEAAPELLEAARQALSDLEWVEKQKAGTNMQASILILRASIRKAEGK